MPTPWKPDTAHKDAAMTPNTAAVDAEAEMVRDLRDEYPDAAEMPAGVRKVLEKHEHQTGKQLTSSMLRTSRAVGKAREDLRKIQDAKAKHRSTWLQHLKSIVETLTKQIESFDAQQTDYVKRIRITKNNIQAQRRELQRLNAQAAADNRADLQANIGEDDTTNEAVVDVEEAALRSQVNELLNKCFKQTEAPIDILSEDDDHMEEERAGKRARSIEGSSALRS
eukprot:s381_g27.t1